MTLLAFSTSPIDFPPTICAFRVSHAGAAQYCVYDFAKYAQMTLFDQSVQTATESLHLTNLRYTAGEGTVLEVVDAQNSLVSAESSRADGAVRYYIALANLQTLTGNMP